MASFAETWWINEFVKSYCCHLVPGTPPSNVTSLSQSSTNQLFIQWMKIPDDDVNGVLTGYVVSHKAVNVGGKKVVDEVVNKRMAGADRNFLMLDGLQSFTTYEIKVAGLTRGGEGAFSNATYAGKTF